MVLTISRPRGEDRIRALDPQTPLAELVHFAAHRNPAVRAVVASRRDCPLASMFALVQDADTRVLHALAANVNAPRSVLQLLAEHKRESVRSIAARRLKYASVR
jgi:hypothetical protein